MSHSVAPINAAVCDKSKSDHKWSDDSAHEQGANLESKRLRELLKT